MTTTDNITSLTKQGYIVTMTDIIISLLKVNVNLLTK